MVHPLLNELNNQQQQAVTHHTGPMLVLAGAGSGKTRVLTFRVAYLIQEYHVDPTSICMVTFTNKAAGEMQERIRHLVGSNSRHELPYAGTFHALCVKILRRDGEHIDIPNTFSIYDSQDQIDAIKLVMGKLDISQKQFHPGAVLSTISQAKNELLTPSEYQNIARGPFQSQVAVIYSFYQKLLMENNALDFDDLLYFTVQLFNTQPSILAEYHNRFSFLLVDEYQDTNKAQYLLSTLLASKSRNICVVGDASQSIYRWRGADYRNITNFKTDFPDAREYHLEQNYRSTQKILDAAYGVISKNTAHPILKLQTTKVGGELVTIYEARNEHDEATYIVQTILQSGKPFTDFAVLYRTNAQSRVLEEVLLHAGIPYVLVGGTRFYERKEIKDVLAYLKIIKNPQDIVSHKRIEKLGKGRYVKFMEFHKSLGSDSKLVELTTIENLDKVLEVTDYLSLYDANIEEEAYRLENIKELRSVAMEFSNLTTFLDNVALVEQEYEPDTVKKREANRTAVTMMTMHAAKGLEYDTIFVIGLEEGLFPHSRSLLDKEELEEERRLCYVAFTRAKNHLYITYANHRLYFGTRTQNMISRFISDIPEGCMDTQVSIGFDRGLREDDMLL